MGKQALTVDERNELKETRDDLKFLESLYFQIVPMLKQIDDTRWPEQSGLGGVVLKLEKSLQKSMAEILGGILSLRHDILAYQGKSDFIEPAEFQEKALLAAIVEARTRGRDAYKEACATALKCLRVGEGAKAKKACKAIRIRQLKTGEVRHV